MSEAEEWRPVVGMEGIFEVSDRGRVRSLPRVLTDGRKWGARSIQAKPSKFGHMSVRLCHNGHHWLWVHRMVLEAFIGPCPHGMEACHNNGIPSDNRVANLRWDTRSGNCGDRDIHGTSLLGARNHLSKLTEDQVMEIRRRKENGVKGVQIAAMFNITNSNVSSICNRKTWRHI